MVSFQNSIVTTHAFVGINHQQTAPTPRTEFNFALKYTRCGKEQCAVIIQYAKDHPDFITVACLEWKPVLQDDRLKK